MQKNNFKKITHFSEKDNLKTKSSFSWITFFHTSKYSNIKKISNIESFGMLDIYIYIYILYILKKVQYSNIKFKKRVIKLTKISLKIRHFFNIGILDILNVICSEKNCKKKYRFLIF